ncbi:hypothetical protein HAZT_HAZT011324 [Hyalella azteca]|uniref:TFIIE beta domain-containing protein n=1 Tax=Hyalella azteca TaxID=294128 RepID=A0A6A0H5B6_HYAAZ|nr:hypothetical protein HAZT_HAZT011324 [Hyalella azteca]
MLLPCALTVFYQMQKILNNCSFKSLAASGNSSQYKFGVLARIVRHMRSRHQEGETHALTLHEILDETNQLNVGPKIKQWLLHEALPSNPKVRESEEGSGACCASTTSRAWGASCSTTSRRVCPTTPGS